MDRDETVEARLLVDARLSRDVLDRPLRFTLVEVVPELPRDTPRELLCAFTVEVPVAADRARALFDAVELLRSRDARCDDVGDEILSVERDGALDEAFAASLDGVTFRAEEEDLALEAARALEEDCAGDAFAREAVVREAVAREVFEGADLAGEAFLAGADGVAFELLRADRVAFEGVDLRLSVFVVLLRLRDEPDRCAVASIGAAPIKISVATAKIPDSRLYLLWLFMSFLLFRSALSNGFPDPEEYHR